MRDLLVWHTHRSALITSYLHLRGMLDGRVSNDSVGTILGPRKRRTVLFSSDLPGVIAT